VLLFANQPIKFRNLWFNQKDETLFWLGDSAWGWKYNFKKFPGEILQGLTDGIPLCCCLYYTLVKTICLLIHGPFNSIAPPNEKNPYGYHKKKPRDGLVFTVLCDAKRLSNGNFFSQDIQDLDYWRCPICRIVDRREKVDWTTGTKWDYSYF